MSSEPLDDQARVQEEDSTAELPILVVDDVAPVVGVATGRARAALPLIAHEATVPIAIPANLLGDAPVERPTLVLMVAVHGMFLVTAIVLVAVLMAVAAT
jgi:hypothetical protein